MWSSPTEQLKEVNLLAVATSVVNEVSLEANFAQIVHGKLVSHTWTDAAAGKRISP